MRAVTNSDDNKVITAPSWGLAGWAWAGLGNISLLMTVLMETLEPGLNTRLGKCQDKALVTVLAIDKSLGLTWTGV